MGNLSPVTTLLGLGADAMNNMFDIKIDLPEDVSAIDLGFETQVPALTIRADGFNPPVFNVKTYKVAWKAVEIERPSTKMTGDRKFDITFRLDANYIGYRLLGAWKGLIMQASSGYVTNALWGSTGDGSSAGNNVLGTVTVSALARPIYMASRFAASGVTDGKFTGDLGTETGAMPTSSELSTWKFENVWLMAMDEPQYKTDGGEAIKIKATFGFGDFTDPVYQHYGQA